MALSVTEKQHWKERIDEKIKRRIEALKSRNAAFFAEAETSAKQAAQEELGIHSELKDIKSMERKVEKLEVEIKERLSNAIQRITGKQPDSYFARMSTVDSELKPHIQRCLNDLLAADPRGQEVLKLESEREQLLDTIWLATSPRQVRDMWAQVLKLLGEDSTEFQKEVLAAAQPED